MLKAVRMKPRTSDELRDVFNTMVAVAKEKFGQEPLMDLQENDEPYDREDVKDPWDLIDTEPGFERAVLVASKVVGEKETDVCEGYGTLVETKSEALTTGIIEDEIYIVRELLRHYEQPDPEFESTDWGEGSAITVYEASDGTVAESGIIPQTDDTTLTLAILFTLEKMNEAADSVKRILYEDVSPEEMEASIKALKIAAEVCDKTASGVQKKLDLA
jgi:hypothetical protein